MGQITGKVVLKETGAGIPNLLVVAYDDQKAPGVPLKSRRLGSVVTNSCGEFAVTYADAVPPGAVADRKARAGTQAAEGPNLRLDVSAPEDPTVNPPPPPLYATPKAREGGAPNESFLIQLPRIICQKAGLQLAGPGADFSQTPALGDLITAMQKLGAVAPKKPDEPFSKRYQVLQDAAAKTSDGKKANTPPIRGFNFAMPIGFTDGQTPEGLSITNDPKTGELLIQNKDEAPTPLTFGGFREAKPQDDQQLSTPDPFLLIDRGKKELQISLVSSPGLLRAATEKRSELLDWYRRQQSQRQA